MKNRVTSTHVLFVLHNELNVFFVADVHQTAGCELILDQNVKVDFNSGFVK